MTGIAVLAMFLAGVGLMRGMQAHLVVQPGVSLGIVLLAYAKQFVAEIVGTIRLWHYGGRLR